MKKRNLILLLGLNLLLVSSISMSLAWFIGSLNLNIEGIDLIVDADASLKISMDDDFEHAKESLTADDFGNPGLFVPVSSMMTEGSEWLSDATVQNPKFIAQYKHTGIKDPDIFTAYGGYFSKKMYLFSDHEMLVTIDSDKTVIEPDKETNESIAKSKATRTANGEFRKVADERIAEQGITDEAIKAQMYDSVKNELIEKYTTQYRKDLNTIDKSLRISILDRNTLNGNDYTIIDPKKEGSTVFGGRLNTSSRQSHYYDFYHDTATDELKEILFGRIKSADHEILYSPAAINDVPCIGTPTCFNSGTRKGVRAIDMTDLATNVTFYEENSITLPEADVSTHSYDENSGYLIQLEPGIPHPLTLSIYLEGWDRDNTDITSEAVFDISVHFKLYRQGGLD